MKCELSERRQDPTQESIQEHCENCARLQRDKDQLALLVDKYRAALADKVNEIEATECYTLHLAA